ncbi:MAG: DUF4293 domain-containing protein [Chitinophagaceae bacterium]
MIQRMQSIWLLLAAIAAFLTLKFSFYSGNIVNADLTKTFTHFNAASKLPTLIFSVIVGVASTVAIFLYKNRKLQMRTALAAMLISLITILLYFNYEMHLPESSFDLTALISLVIPVLLFLAVRGIYKDQKLVKSLDRLR